MNSIIRLFIRQTSQFLHTTTEKKNNQLKSSKEIKIVVNNAVVVSRHYTLEVYQLITFDQ